jgi:Ser/Thr protein kinase RdoA (MazF antagonist)
MLLVEIQNVCKKSQTANSLLDSQLALSSLLAENGIPNPEIVQQRDGKFWSLEKFGDLCLPVRLFRFMPGKMLQDVKQSGELYLCVGRLLARFHKVTEKFDDSAYRRHVPFLSLENLDCIRREIGLLLELKLVTWEQSQLLEGAFDQYDRRVNSNRDQYEEGTEEKYF